MGKKLIPELNSPSSFLQSFLSVAESTITSHRIAKAGKVSIMILWAEKIKEIKNVPNLSDPNTSSLLRPPSFNRKMGPSYF